MNITAQDFNSFILQQMMEADPLAEITLSCLRKVMLSPLPREKKFRQIIEFNLPFSILHYCLIELQENQLISLIDYAYFFLQLRNWYRKASYVT